MAHVQKRTYRSARTGKVNTTWQARYTAPDGRERTKRFERKVDAEAWLDTNGADMVRGAWIDPKAGRVTFAKWSEQWKATTVNLRASTRARDLGYLERYIIPTFGPMKLAAIDHMTVAGWVAQLTGDGPVPWWNVADGGDRKRRPVSSATAVKAHQILGKIMAAAVDAGRIASSPCERVPLPRIEREEMRFLTTPEVDRLAEAIKPRYRALVLVAAYGGLRIGELAGLRRGRVDVLRNRIDVAEIVVEVGGRLVYGAPKTRAGRRSLTLPATVMAALNDHLANFTELDPDALVFTAPEGGPLRVPAWRRRFWNPAVAAAGLAPLRPHDLRHTAVALWIASGANPLEVSRRAGHTSTSFTLDRYGHLFPDVDQSVAERLEALISDGRKTDEVRPGSSGRPKIRALTR